MKRKCHCGRDYDYISKVATEYEDLLAVGDEKKAGELKKKLDFEMLMTPNVCPVCIDEHNDMALFESVQEEKQIDESAELERFGIRPRHYKCTFENFIADTDKKKSVLESCKRMTKSKTGLIVMIGNNGVGKTHLLAASAKAIGAGRIYKMIEIGMFIRKYIGSTTIDEQSQLDALIRLPFLAIDEFDKCKRSESDLIWLSYIIDERNERRRATILSGNCHPEKTHTDGKKCEKCFETIVTPDILDRISQYGTLHYLDWESIRPKLRGKE
jgi:DNA replication protein DnaC